VIVLWLTASATAAQDIQFFRIGTGTTGGTYFPIGGIIANVISGPPGAPPCDVGGSCGVPGLIAVAQASSGSVENIESIRSNTMESGLTQADIAFWAYSGEELFAEQGPMSDLRAIAHLYNELFHVVVPADSDIETIGDLAGKRVSIGDEGSGTLVDARIVLDAYGLSEEDIEPYYLQPEVASDRMLAGGLDALIFIGGVPTIAVEDLARRMIIRLIPITGPPARKLLQRVPFFLQATLDEGAYANVGAVRTIAVGATWVTSADIDDDLIYGITRALWHPQSLRLLADSHPRGEEIKLENAVSGIAIPIHDGALRFYRETGVLATDAMVK
jgi:TRAP transporter TAXI family solute receptor